jgi:hypothetical protein
MGAAFSRDEPISPNQPWLRRLNRGSRPSLKATGATRCRLTENKRASNRLFGKQGFLDWIRKPGTCFASLYDYFNYE